MANKIVTFILTSFSSVLSTLLGKYIFIFIISLMPILELRGGLIAASLLNMNPYMSLIVCLIANILIIPFVLLLIEKILEFLKRFKWLNKLITKWEKKALKNKKLIEKYSYIGIMIFVAIPLPGSGAWTGCLLAVLLGLDKKKSFIYALLGVLIAAFIMMIFSFGLLKGIIG